MADITIPGMFLTGDHASRPAASAVGGGALYSCTDDNLIYQSDGSTWSTWATVGGGGGGGGGTSIPNLAVGTWQALGWVSAVGTSSGFAASRAYFAKFIPTADVTVAAAAWHCTTSAGNLDFAIYNGAHDTKLSSTGSFASPGTGDRTQALTSSLAMTAGTPYYLTFSTSSTSLRIPAVIPAVGMGYGAWNLYGLQSSAGVPLPASLTPSWDSAGAAYPIFWFTE